MKLRATSGQLRAVQWIKFKVAYWLDDKKKNWCWAHLATWALGHTSTWQAFNPWSGEVYYQLCPDQGPYAWCGKCEVTGKMKKYYKKLKENHE